MTYAVLALCSLVLAAALTPLCIRIARRYRILDTPEDRKIHTKPVPYLGGVAIFVAHLVVLGGFVLLRGYSDTRFLFPYAVCASATVLLGLWDDVHGVRPLPKLLVQIVIAVTFAAWHGGISRLTVPWGDAVSLGFLSIPLTAFWILVLMNAVNLLDGLDGLAGGVTAIATLFFLLIAAREGSQTAAYGSAVLLGAILGFLFYNHPPAKIFMGDTGSMFLGFTLAVHAVAAESKSRIAITLLGPIVLLLIPIADSVLAVLRRVRERRNIFQADKSHLHHRLLNLAMSYRQVLLLIYLFSISLGLFAVLATKLAKQTAALLLGNLLLLVGTGVLAIWFLEKREGKTRRSRRR